MQSDRPLVEFDAIPSCPIIVTWEKRPTLLHYNPVSEQYKCTFNTHGKIWGSLYSENSS